MLKFVHYCKFLWLIAGVFTCNYVMGQIGFTPQDCAGAIPVCQSVYTSTTPSIGSGNVPNEVSTSLSCLGAGEINSVWYTFNIQTSGNLSFVITPTNPANDYDFAVFNLTGASCPQIATDPSLMVSCNFTGQPGPTGANGGPPPGFEPVIPVQAGETYVLIMSIFSTANQQGYTIDFTSSTAQIYDNIPPQLDSIVTPIPCQSNQLDIFFSENVNCAGITPSLFQLTGPGGPYTVTAVTAPNCLAGGQYSAGYTLTIDPPITSSGNFSLNLTSSISDLCGNTTSASNANTLTFDIINIVVDSTYSTQSDCNVNNGTAGIAISGGTPPVTYLWSPGGQTTALATGLGAGSYTVTVTDGNQCQVTETVQVTNPINFSLSLAATPDTCEKGVGTATVTATGTSGPFTYLWNDPAGSTTPNANWLIGTTNYTVQVTDAQGCVLMADTIVGNIENQNLVAYFEALPDTVDLLFPLCKLTNLSTDYVSYQWNYLNRVVTDTLNPVIKFNHYGVYPVNLIVYDINGCKSFYSRDIYVVSNIYYYVPSAFTPNDDEVNEIWMPQGIGFDTTTYSLEIYDAWGSYVYYNYNYKKGWDGKHIDSKKLCPQGSYTYKITFKDMYGREAQYIGRLMLLR
jgi:gliding motility-associated-like protein